MTWRRLLLLLPLLVVLAVVNTLVQRADISGVETTERIEAPFSPDTEVLLSRLTPEAQSTYAAIRRGGPFPYSKDGSIFFNRERLLPERKRGYYTEYTVPTPGERDRGARRIIAGGKPSTGFEFWYTDDHYRSFRRIRE